MEILVEQVLAKGSVDSFLLNSIAALSAEESITALLDRFGQEGGGEEDHTPSKQLMLHLFTLVFSLHPPEEIGMELRLCVAMFLAELATTPNDVLLVAVVQTTNELLLSTYLVLLKPPPAEDDSELRDSLLREVDALRQYLSGLLTRGGADTQRTQSISDEEASNYFYAKRQVVLLMVSLCGFALENVAGGSEEKLHLPLLLTIFSQSAAALVGAVRSVSSPVSLAVSAVYHLHAILRDCHDDDIAVFSLPSAALGHLSSTLLGMIAEGSDLLRLTSVTRPLRRLLTDVVRRFSRLSAAARSALEAILEGCGGPFEAPTPCGTTSRQPHAPVLDELAWRGTFCRKNETKVPEAANDTTDECDANGDPSLAENVHDGMLELHSVGRIPIEEVVSMVFESLQRMAIDVVTEAGHLERMHLAGLRESQLVAARLAQSMELERIRLQEAQHIEEVPAGKLVYRVDGGGAAALRNATQLLDRTSARSAIQKRAFFSILKTFKSLRQSHSVDEASLRAGQALVARTLAQLPLAVSDSALDALCELLLEEARDERGRGGGPKAAGSPNTYFSLALQLLFMRFAQLAPTTSTAASSSFSSGSSTLTFDATQVQWNLQNPVGWLSSSTGSWMDVEEASGASNRKRQRDEEEFAFVNDTADQATAYSHAFQRILTVFVDVNRVDLILELLMQCPRITNNVWNYILQKLCLGDRTTAPIGIFALSHIANKRRVYKAHALSILVFLADCAKVDPRRLAVAQLGKLLDQGVVDASMEPALVQYAIRLMAKVPLARAVKAEVLASDHLDPATSDKEKQQTLSIMDRSLGLFLMLCSRKAHTKALLPTLFTIQEECGRQGNFLAQQLLVEHRDVHRLFQELFRDPAEFLRHAMPAIRRSPKSSERLVHQVLQIVSSELFLSAQQSSRAPPTDPDTLSKRSTWMSVAQSLFANAKALYDESQLPLFDAAGGASRGFVRDIRYMIPFLGLAPRAELKSQYLIGLLQFSGTNAFDVNDVRRAMKEMLVKFPLDFTDGHPRGIGPLELMIHLHDLHQQHSSKSKSGAANSHLQGAEGLVTASMFSSVVQCCLSLTKTFDTTTTQLLYDVKEALKCLHHLLKQRPIPSQTMLTAILCCRNHNNHPELLQFISSTMLSQFAKDHVWDHDALLWRGVMLFCDEHWDDTQWFLFNLPDRVLLAALRENPRMKEMFKVTHATNASFSHIVAAL